MAIKASVLKRIEEAEQSSVSRRTPDLVMIHYDWESGFWIACEQYVIGKHKGCKSKVIRLNHFNDYVVPKGFTGTIIIDDIDCPSALGGDEYDVVTIERV